MKILIGEIRESWGRFVERDNQAFLENRELHKMKCDKAATPFILFVMGTYFVDIVLSLKFTIDVHIILILNVIAFGVLVRIRLRRLA